MSYSLWKKIFYKESDISKKCDALYNMMRVCKEAEAWDNLKEVLETYDDLKVNEFAEEVARFKKILNAKLATRSVK